MCVCVCCVVQAKKKDKLLTMDPKEITYEMVNKKLREIIMSRGRRGTDKQEQVRTDGTCRTRNSVRALHRRRGLFLVVAL